MKRLQIKQKVILYFTAVLLLLTALVYMILQGSIAHQAREFALETLRQASEAACNEIELDDGMLELDDDLDDIENILVYDADGRALLYGRIPAFDAPLRAGEARQVEGDNGSVWYVYDVLHTLSPALRVWVRASVRMDSSRSMERYVRTVFLWMFLPLLLLGVLGGYGVTRRAFRPLAQMAQTARRIAGGDDLSARIGLSGTDEFSQLAQVFDAMLARLQSAFAQERRFTMDASHELRTPLAVIQAQCELALAEPAQQPKALQVIQGQTQRLTRMVRELLTLSRMDAHTQPLHRESVNLSELMAIVAEELQGTAACREIAIETALTPNCTLQGDESLLLRMLINLVSNAIQFGKPGGIVRLSLRREDETLIGTVEDDGAGMTAEQLAHIYERFYQADPARAAAGSSGLGLSMVQWIVQAHCGEIDAQSTPGEGSVFCFRLPQSGCAQ